MTDTSRRLENIGVEAPPDFPFVPYSEIFLAVRTRSSEQPLWDEFGGAWNAAAYRFLAVVHYADAFRESLATHGTTPAPPIRSEQERVLFGFFTNAVSCIEATYYGLFAVGAYLAPTAFRLETADDKRNVTPSATHKTYAQVFAAQPIVEELRVVLEDKAFGYLRDTRNIVAHRSQPGRFIGERVEWKLGPLVLTPEALNSQKADVARLLATLLEPAAPFVSGRFK